MADGLDKLFQCSIHKVSFDTPDEYYQHERDVEHHRRFTKHCTSCGEVNVSREETAKIPFGKMTPQESKCRACQEEQDIKTVERLKAEGKI